MGQLDLFRTSSTSIELYSPGIPISFHAAYKSCCIETDNQNNCTREDDDWFARIIAKRTLVSAGRSTLYWAHMRKAGGTSFGKSIESAVFNHTSEQRSTFHNGFTRTVKVHLQAGSSDCVDHEFSNETLFVTILRHPIDRYISEFLYLNLGQKMESNSSEFQVIEWYNRSLMHVVEGNVNMGAARSDFIDNWQTRWYTNPNRCEDLDRPPPHDSHPNYSYWRSGHTFDSRTSLGENDLIAARRVLDKFDIVGIAPFFGHVGECDMVPWLILAGSNKPVNATNEIANKGVTSRSRQQYREELLGNATILLHDHVKFDLPLFAYAQELVRKRKALSCCVMNLVGQDKEKI